MATNDNMTLDSYLSNHSKNRRIDGVIKQWHGSNFGSHYQEKTKNEWDKIINTFFSEVDRVKIKPIEPEKEIVKEVVKPVKKIDEEV